MGQFRAATRIEIVVMKTGMLVWGATPEADRARTSAYLERLMKPQAASSTITVKATPTQRPLRRTTRLRILQQQSSPRWAAPMTEFAILTSAGISHAAE